MKAIKSLALFALVVCFFSCDDTDTVTPVNKDNLTGTYQLQVYTSQETRTETINGFDVETTTKIDGDTFNMQYTFQENDTVALNGTYRLVETKKLGEQTSDTSYIVSFSDQKLPYQINDTQTELTIDQTVYKIQNFNESGFQLLKETSSDTLTSTTELQLSK